MGLEERKYEFIQKLFTVNETLFEKLETVLNEEAIESQRISIEQYNKELDESIAQIERGEFYTQEEVEKMAKEW